MPEGQAVFSIKGDPSRPFDVLAGPLRITVVGTRSSVRFTPGIRGEEGVQVAVEEGRVRVGHWRMHRKAPTRVGATTTGTGPQVAFTSCSAH